MSQIRFYDLELNIPKQIWSPNTCKTRFALNVKNIPYETEWVNFTNLAPIVSSLTKSNVRPTVPIIVDLVHGNKVIQDSWDIAVYLEEAFPDKPSLFHGNIGVHKFFHDYVSHQIMIVVFKLFVLTVHQNCGSPQMQEWFRNSREAMFGVSLETLAGDPNQHASKLKQLLFPIKKILEKYPYMTGEKVGWADISLCAVLTPLAELKPEQFKPMILEAFGLSDNTFSHWWDRMEKYRTTRISPRL